MKSRHVLHHALALALVAGGTLVPNAFADREKAGNGGNAAVCFNSSAEVKRIKANENRIANDQLGAITSIKALDLYQAEAVFKGVAPAKNLVLPKPGEDGVVYVARIAKRYETTIPTLMDALNAQAATFNPKKNTYYTEGGIDRIYDTAEKYYLEPSKCVVATLIRRTTVGGQAELEYDWRLFNHRAHKNESRGVLYLHEVVYKWASYMGQESSYNTRRLLANAILRRDVGRSETLTELANDGFKLDASSANATAEYRQLGSFDAVVDGFEQAKVSPATAENVKKVLAGLLVDVSLGTLQELRESMISLRSADPIYKALPKPKHDEAAKADAAVTSIDGQIYRCKSPDIYDRKFCRQHAEELPGQLAQARSAAAIAHEAEGAEATANQTKAETIRTALTRELEPEFVRLAEKAPDAFDAHLAKIAGFPWFDAKTAAALRDYSGCLRSYYALNTPKPSWNDVHNSCGTQDASFLASWQTDRPIPVVE